jgi:GH24 family phage-related lysozyme (muramidase)
MEPLRIPRNLVNGQPVNEVSPAGRDFTYAAEDYVPEGYDDGIGKSAINIKVQDNKGLPVGRLSGRLTIGYGTNLEAAYDANGDVASSAYIQVINEHVERNADGYAVLKTDNETVEERKKAAQNKHAKDLYAYYVEHYQTTVTDALRNNDVKLKQHEYDAIRDIEYNGPEMSRIIIEKINTIGKREAMRDFGWRLGKNRSLFKGLWVRRYNQIRLFLDGVYEYVERDDARGPFDSLFNQSHIRALLPPYSELDTIPLGEIKGFTDP